MPDASTELEHAADALAGHRADLLQKRECGHAAAHDRRQHLRADLVLQACAALPLHCRHVDDVERAGVGVEESEGACSAGVDSEEDHAAPHCSAIAVAMP